MILKGVSFIFSWAIIEANMRLEKGGRIDDETAFVEVLSGLEDDAAGGITSKKDVEVLFSNELFIYLFLFEFRLNSNFGMFFRNHSNHVDVYFFHNFQLF